MKLKTKFNKKIKKIVIKRIWTGFYIKIKWIQMMRGGIEEKRSIKDK
jgi:hypothetical protein